jgi:tRNA-dihydrouridine synthase 3
MMQDGNKNKAKSANDDNPDETRELNGDGQTESLPVNVEPDSTLCKAIDNSEGEPLVVNSVQCVESRPLKKSKVEVDGSKDDGNGNLLPNLDMV